MSYVKLFHDDDDDDDELITLQTSCFVVMKLR
jgi:hypothetical protein